MQNVLNKAANILAIFALTFSTIVHANNENNSLPDQEKLRAQFSKLGLVVTEIKNADIKGLVEIHTTQAVFFSNYDASYFIAGTLYGKDSNGNYQDILAARKAPINAQKIQAESEYIEYKATNDKYVITVFTDITCPYCVKLHDQVSEYNKLGISVRYLAYPRQGLQAPSAEQMAKIWCSIDPKASLDNSKKSANTSPMPSAKDLSLCKNIVARHFALGKDLDISGTPAIFLPSGELIAGYVPPKQLLLRLQKQSIQTQ